ncbi:MAG: amidohydrolase family protein [Gemmatimonadota bacterium]|nr:amidohydrolase family protein [Gemmatimonadota bacterium]
MLKPDHLQAHTHSAAPPGATPEAQEATVVFTNTTVANPDLVQDDVALAVEGDRIAAIVPTDEVLAGYPWAEIQDGRGKALFPGLINTHAHMRAVIARGFNEDFGFPNTAGLAISPASLLEGEEGNLMVQVAALEAIRTGTTTIVEYTGNVGRQAGVLADSGLRCVLAEGIRDTENQSRAEYEFMVMHHGLRPAEYLDRHDFLGPRLFAAHARYVNTEEVALLGRSGTIIAHQAGMAANRGISPPIPELRAAGCPIALGTDNNTNDVFEVMRIAMLTERIRRNRDGDEVPGLQPQPEDVLADCTQGGALAVQQPDALGTLEVGKKADLLVVDMLRAHLVPAGRVISALVHSGHPGDIESVMVDGRFVMRDREVVTMDEDAIIREADAVGKRIWGQVLEASPLNVPRLRR